MSKKKYLPIEKQDVENRHRCADVLLKEQRDYDKGLAEGFMEFAESQGYKFKDCEKPKKKARVKK